jgi:hypothetical protein
MLIKDICCKHKFQIIEFSVDCFSRLSFLSKISTIKIAANRYYLQISFTEVLRFLDTPKRFEN